MKVSQEAQNKVENENRGEITLQQFLNCTLLLKYT